ncbi:transposase [Myxococcota bacterium]|nr:transposase [Myxococcota bacterium]
MSRRARRVFTREEKADAVGLVRRSGLSIAQISRDLDIGENSLRSWVKQADIDDGHGPDGELTTTEREELRQLRRKVRGLEQEQEFLKKWACLRETPAKS